MNEEQILSEYIDGELPADLVAVVATRLQRDAAFRARYERLCAVRAQLKLAADLPEAELVNAQARVWQRLQRNLAPRPSRIPAWFAALGDLVSTRISLPVPALAGLAVVFLAVLSFAALNRPATAGNEAAVASAGSTGQAAMSIPSLNQNSAVVPGIGITPAAFTEQTIPGLSGSTRTPGTGMAVTFEVQNLRQLLSLLENSQGIRELSIQLPQQSFEAVGEPALLSASDLAGQTLVGTGSTK